MFRCRLLYSGRGMPSGHLGLYECEIRSILTKRSGESLLCAWKFLVFPLILQLADIRHKIRV